LLEAVLVQAFASGEKIILSFLDELPTMEIVRDLSIELLRVITSYMQGKARRNTVAKVVDLASWPCWQNLEI
jgi:hypothetical protein